MDRDWFHILVHLVIKAESYGNPDAMSPKGAKGLMQLMDATAIETMIEIGMDPEKYDPWDAVQNKLIGEAYLRKMLGLFDDIKLALAAYNAGPGRVSRLRKQYGKTYREIETSLPKETQDYVAKITLGLADKGIIL